MTTIDNGDREKPDAENPDAPLMSKSIDKGDPETTKTVSTTAEEAPWNTQMFWLGVWMIKYVERQTGS